MGVSPTVISSKKEVNVVGPWKLRNLLNNKTRMMNKIFKRQEVCTDSKQGCILGLDFTQGFSKKIKIIYL
jgi:hypothetical protein